MTKWGQWATTALFLMVSAAPASAPSSGQPPLRLTGAWSGTAEIFDNWTEHRTIDVTIFVAADSTVTGTIGQAVLPRARLQPNRGWFGRWLGIKTDWIVTGELDGYLIPAEGLKGTRVMMPLNWVDDHFEGSLVAQIPGPAGRTRLTAGHLRLERLGTIARHSRQDGGRYANR